VAVQGNVASEGDVAAMFDAIAGRYDLLNDLLSMGQVRLWRRTVARITGARPGERVLDLAAGTGTSSLTFTATGADCVACDFSLGMLQAGKSRPGGVRGGGQPSRDRGASGGRPPGATQPLTGEHVRLEPLGLHHGQRQHGDCHRLMRQCEVDRNLIEQRQDSQRRLQSDRSDQPERAIDGATIDARAYGVEGMK